MRIWVKLEGWGSFHQVHRELSESVCSKWPEGEEYIKMSRDGYQIKF
jgi:hypothetical protein